MAKRWQRGGKRWQEVVRGDKEVERGGKEVERGGKKGSKMTATIDWSQFMFIPGIVKVGGSKWVILVIL